MAAVISGAVRDADGNPVANARIAFVGAPVDVPDIAALTDSAGRFALSAPAPGRYVIGCYAEGYSPATVAVDVADVDAYHIEVHLKA